MHAAPARRVLIVEDEPDLRELLVALLESEGYTVESAGDGAEALHRLDQCAAPTGHFSLVLLDMMVPFVEGQSVLHYIARLGWSVPVVAMSADHGLLAAAVAAGARATLAKPFDIEVLLAVVKRNCTS